MMEFTYEGIVRQGFGFYNPNHAAALLAAFFPLLLAAWQQQKTKAGQWAAGLATLLLTVMLALTFSRTGVLVLLGELLAFAVLSAKIERRKLLLLGGGMVLILIFAGVWARFVPDRAFGNRFVIWQAGAALAAANPASGVGFGNSGLLASAFLLPDAITCRTLVNSHLTLLAEFGLIAGFAWFTWIFYALLKGFPKRAAWIAFAGLCFSAASASIFDWGVLFDFREYGELPVGNFLLSWGLFALFAGLGIYLSYGRFEVKKAAAAAGAALTVTLAVLLWRSPTAPVVEGDFVVRRGENIELVLRDDRWTLREVKPFLPEAYRLSIHSYQRRDDAPVVPAARVWLFGECAAFARHYPESRLIFISPPEFFELPSNTEKVFLKRFREKRDDFTKISYY
ncbi:MAG: O-antigen ligase family protein [Victivallaceae bacterium]